MSKRKNRLWYVLLGTWFLASGVAAAMFGKALFDGLVHDFERLIINPPEADGISWNVVLIIAVIYVVITLTGFIGYHAERALRQRNSGR